MNVSQATYQLTDDAVGLIPPDEQHVYQARRRGLIAMSCVITFLMGFTWFSFFRGEIQGASWAMMIVMTLMMFGMIPLAHWWVGREWKEAGLIVSAGVLVLKAPRTEKMLEGNESDTLCLGRNARGTKWILWFSDDPRKTLKVLFAFYPDLDQKLQRLVEHFASSEATVTDDDACSSSPQKGVRA